MKLTINMDATSLGHSACILDLYRTIVGSVDSEGKSAGGYRDKLAGVSMVYGIAVHKFIDTAFKTKGDLTLARKHAHKMFNEIPTQEAGKLKGWLRDPRHLDVVCFNLWTDFVMEENNFQLLELVLPCWLCKGAGTITSTVSPPLDVVTDCPICKGAKVFLQPATEVTFSIRYYEDDYIIVNLCGTIDKIGKFKSGAFAIGDWKTTSSWHNEGYFQQYELSRQLRMYTLAIKLMGQMYPESTLGRIGQTQVSCFIDAVFLNKDPNIVKVERSDLFTIRPADLDAFQLTLDDKIKQVSQAVKTGYLPKEGILNGTCVKVYGKCSFWDCCRNPDSVSEVLLKRDYARTHFDPLKYNDV
jgi:hypothetical protein